MHKLVLFAIPQCKKQHFTTLNSKKNVLRLFNKICVRKGKLSKEKNDVHSMSRANWSVTCKMIAYFDHRTFAGNTVATQQVQLLSFESMHLFCTVVKTGQFFFKVNYSTDCDLLIYCLQLKLIKICTQLVNFKKIVLNYCPIFHAIRT